MVLKPGIPTSAVRTGAALLFVVGLAGGFGLRPLSGQGLARGGEAAPGAAQSRPWFGLALACSHCSTEGRRGTWSFSDPPVIYLVDPGGPAERAGLRMGDVLTHVDSLDITSRAAGQYLSAATPDDTLTFHYRRDGERHATRLIVGEFQVDQAQARERALAEMRQAERAATRDRGRRETAGAPERTAGLRYAGTLGDVDISVNSSEPVVVDEFRDEVVIRVGDTEVRLRRRSPAGE